MAAQALVSCIAHWALIHQDRPITTVYMPLTPPFLNTCHFSPFGVLWTSESPSILQDGCIVIHHFMNCWPYMFVFTGGTTSFFLLLIQCETCDEWHFVGKFCMPHSSVKFHQEWEGELTPFGGPHFLNSTNAVTRSCQAAF